MNAPLRLPERLAVYTDATVRGGAEQVLANLLVELSPRIAVTVVAVSEGIGEWLASHRPGAEVMLVPPVRNKGDLRPVGGHVRTLWKLRPEILHVNQPTPWSCQYAIAAGLALPGVRVVSVEHSPIASQSRAQRLIRRRLMRGVDAHVSVSRAAARLVERRLGVPPNRVHAIHNGVPDLQPPPRERISEGPVIGTITRVDQDKGLDVLVEALPDLPGVQAVIVGEGPALEDVKALAERRGVADRLTTTGFEPEPRDYLGSFDVFVLPSRFEAFPLAVLEAMLAELPVVASDVGGVGEAVVDGETGLLVPADDPRALAAALRRLLADPDLRDRMGRRGRSIAAERFRADRMARDFEQLYARLLTRSAH